MPSPDALIKLILRVSGDDIPTKKTLNEVAIMQWVEQSTSIPIPKIIAFDASDQNPVKHEFTLLEYAEGTSIDNIYTKLTSHQKEYIVEQLTNFVIELHSHPFNHMGGLSLNTNGEVVPGPVIEVRSWHTPSMIAAWGPNTSQSLETLNVQGPFNTWTDYCIARLKTSQHAMSTHPRLQKAKQELNSQVEHLLTAIEAHKQDLNPGGNTAHSRYVLAHKDMHLGNIMCDPETCRITAVLDWEFAQVAPLPAWNPGNFLWNGLSDASSSSEKAALMQIFERQCRMKGKEEVTLVETTRRQHAMQSAVEWLGWAVRDGAMGLDEERVRGDREGFEEAVRAFES